MGVEADRAAQAIAQWKKSRSTTYFDDIVLPLLEAVQERVREETSAETVAEWLELDAAMGAVADEQVGNFTLDLIENSPDLVAEAQTRLTAVARASLTDSVEQWPRSDSFKTAAEFDLPAAELTADTVDVAEFFTTELPVCVAFSANGRTINRKGFPIIEGSVALTSRAGQNLGTFACNTGGSASAFDKQGGPLPPGTYIASAFRVRTKQGMVRDGVGYSLNLDPAPGTRVFGRSLFRIHPDQDPKGTLGCLGIDEDGQRAREAMAALQSLAGAGNFLVKVDLGNFA